MTYKETIFCCERDISPISLKGDLFQKNHLADLETISDFVYLFLPYFV